MKKTFHLISNIILQSKIFLMAIVIILIAAAGCLEKHILKDPSISTGEIKNIEEMQPCEAGELLAFKPSHGLLISKEYVEPSIRKIRTPVVLKKISRSCREGEREADCLSSLVDESLRNLTPALKNKVYRKHLSCNCASVYTWLELDGQDREQRFVDDRELAAFLLREQERGRSFNVLYYKRLINPRYCTAHIYVVDIENTSNDCLSKETPDACRSRVQREMSEKCDGAEIRVNLHDKRVSEAALVVDGSKIEQQFPDVQSVERYVEMLRKQGRQVTVVDVLDNARMVHAAEAVFTRYEEMQARVFAIRIRWRPDRQKPGIFWLGKQGGKPEPVLLTSEERRAQIEELRDELSNFIVLSFEAAPDGETSAEIGCTLPEKRKGEPIALHNERALVKRVLPENWVIPRGENNYRITRKAREAIMADISILGVGTTMVPYFVSGVRTGIKLLVIDPGSPLLDLGFKENDVLYSIEGIPLNSADNFLEVWRAEKQNAISVEISRGSNRLVLIYELSH